MKKLRLNMAARAAAVAALAFAAPATAPAFAQSQQDQLDARYDRALAAGYKALFLCGAIANAERNGTRLSTAIPTSAQTPQFTDITWVLSPLRAAA